VVWGVKQSPSRKKRRIREEREREFENEHGDSTLGYKSIKAMIWRGVRGQKGGERFSVGQKSQTASLGRFWEDGQTVR